MVSGVGSGDEVLLVLLVLVRVAGVVGAVGVMGVVCVFEGVWGLEVGFETTGAEFEFEC